MGWTSYPIDSSESTPDVLRREFKTHTSGTATWELAIFRMYGSAFYGVMCRTEPDATRRAAGSPEKLYYGLVVLTKREPGKVDGRVLHTIFNFKCIGEEDGPFYYDAPATILNFLDQHAPTPDGRALEWRAKCRERIQSKRARAQDKKKLN